ncbi:MAG: aspartate/tyrosine/aromatic aminotransferase [Acidobacteria bacterium]|nr:aspartate/tyrosine/aromatic aminotransferase [Acidobacteriota bacterium]
MMRAMPESPRVHGVQAPVIPILGRWIRETPGTISLGQGVVSYGPPPAALDAARRFGADPADHLYGPVEGDPELVEALTGKLAVDNGIRLGTESRLVVTAGANMAFMNAVLATADPGDEVILQAPYYFNHEMAVGIAGCRAVAVATDGQYQLVPERIAEAVTSRTRAVVTISPNNPSGAVYPEAALRAVNELCAVRGIYHIHDEAYEYFVYDGARHFSPGSMDAAGSHTISLFSMSKSYGMASWRIGYMVLPSHLVEAVNKIQDTVLICPARVSQRSALAALGEGRSYCDTHVTRLAGVRRAVYARLAEIADARLDDGGRAPGTGAPRGGRARRGVWPDRRVPPARVVWRPRSGHGRGRPRPSGRRSARDCRLISTARPGGAEAPLPQLRVSAERRAPRFDYVPNGFSSDGLWGVNNSAPFSVISMSSSTRTPNSPRM